MKKKKGIFIVVDGTDGSGKATQVALLVKHLRRAGHAVAVADFPRYGEKSAGLIEEYLTGAYGGPKEVGPYRASIFYACDRYAASFAVRRWLAEGKVVVSNRYVTANMGHQGGKIKSVAARKKYFRWLYDLEYRLFSIPKPDLNLILHVDAKVAQTLAKKRWQSGGGRGKKKDIHENDLSHLRAAERAYLEIARTFRGFSLVECTEKGNIMPREKIAGLVWERVKKVL